jgi:hypothetical protein
VVGKTRCRVATRMAQWVASKDDERQQGMGATNSLIWQTGPLSNNKTPHPLMDCGQGKSSTEGGNNGPATGRGLDEGSGNVEIGQDGG